MEVSTRYITKKKFETSDHTNMSLNLCLSGEAEMIDKVLRLLDELEWRRV